MKPAETGKVVLVVDDEEIFCKSLENHLRGGAFEVLVAHRGRDAVEICARRKVDVVLLDQKLPDGRGSELYAPILERNELTKIIFITAFPNYENAVEAIKVGAFDYLSKPIDLGELDLALTRSLRTLELERIEQFQRYDSAKRSEETLLVGGLDEIRRLADLAAASDAPVLVTGDTGAGKNVVARLIHYGGPRRAAPFVVVNCAALPENLVETELFGHEKGAFSGAGKARRGVFEMAEGGTLVLDEIGAMPTNLQSKLLSVLEDKKLRRIGGESERSVDVRVVAATNTDLEAALRENRFRKDLYYRLNVFRIHLPPLR